MNCTPDYDWCYRMLGLEPGALPDVIKKAYRQRAFEVHPDRAPADQKLQATRKFQEISQAHQDLKQYWKEHGCAPPSMAQQAEQERQEAERQRREAEAREAEARRAREEQLRQEQERQRRTEEARQRMEAELRRRRLPIVYPAFQKTWLHKLHDYLHQPDKEWLALGGGFALLIFPPILMLRLLSALIGQDVGRWLGQSDAGVLLLALWVLWGMFSLGNLCAHSNMYRIHAARGPRTVRKSTKRVWNALDEILSTYRYHGHAWLPDAKTEDPDDATVRCSARLVFPYKLLGVFDLTYAVTLVIKVKASAETERAAVVCYWFEVQTPWYWLRPAATVLKDTRAALERALRG